MAQTDSSQRVFTLANTNGMEVRVAEYGATVLSIRVPDRDGLIDDVTLGFDRVEDYTTHGGHFGAVVGRYANRIANGQFTLDGRSYQLARNNGPNHLHGGVRGFDKMYWSGERSIRNDDPAVSLRYTSAEGEEGYPGAVDVTVTYTVTPINTLIVAYRAVTNAPTPINLTQHSYFNLAGSSSTHGVLDHMLTLNATAYTPVDAGLIPTGQIEPVEGTPFDFRAPMAIGARINADNDQLRLGNGYDHNFVIDRAGAGLVQAAHVSESTTGRTLDVRTTEPGVQLYTANSLDGTVIGKGGRPYRRFDAFCLETQHYPDSPNHPAFPSTILRPGKPYQSRTEFAFGIA